MRLRITGLTIDQIKTSSNSLKPIWRMTLKMKSEYEYALLLLDLIKSVHERKS